MPIYTLTLLGRKEVARKTFEYTFKKPDGFTYQPGQYGGFTLINPPEADQGGITRRFSLLSSPHEETLTIAMRTQGSAYKRVLASLQAGAEIKFAGPTGNFTLHTDTDIPAVFIAGGIGITPFLSMIRDASSTQTNRSLTLFYGNQTLEDAAYYDELKQHAHILEHFTFVPVLAAPSSDWQGERGFITHTLIRQYVHDIQTPIFYICGSPAMVAALQETVIEMGITHDHTKVEDFPGY